MQTQTRVIDVQGMTCGGCVKSVENAVNQLSGIKSVNVDLNNNKATVEYNDTQVEINAIIDAIEDAGFDTNFYD